MTIDTLALIKEKLRLAANVLALMNEALRFPITYHSDLT
jgi:hypothetical protein